jgi:predicted Zn-dependent protease
VLSSSADRDVRDALAVYGHLLLDAQQVTKAHAVFEGMAVLFPDDALVSRSLAVTSLALGRPQVAVEHALRARDGATGVEAVAIDVVRARALAALGRQDEARSVMAAALTARALMASGPPPRPASQSQGAPSRRRAP